MGALALVGDWPAPHVAAAVVTPGAVREQAGDPDHRFRLASLAKVITAWAVLVAVEDGSLHLDDPLGPPGSTVRHVLAHASGLGFDTDAVLAPPGRRRIYSNTGYELLAAHTARRTGIPFAEYAREAVCEPLDMADTDTTGSPAKGFHSTLADMERFVAELLRPTLLAPGTVAEATRPQLPDLPGVVPGLGSYDPCPWGLGPELKGAKDPHWTGRTNSAATFGHFGGAGTMMWVDPVADIALVALTDRPFDDWADEALTRWPELSDEVLARHGAGAGAS
jgi:CubicO group peptidase (beta-lactamase class C family)